MRNNRRIVVWAVLISACLITPLIAGKVKAFTGKNADFARYKTYQWFPPRVLTMKGIVENHPANPIIKEAIGQQLSERGLSEVASGADLQIQVWVLTESVPQLEAVIINSAAVEPGTFATLGDPVDSISRYNRQGSLYLNLIDSRTKKSAWFAMVTESLPTGTLDPGQIRSKLDKAAKSVFSKYPDKK